MNRWITLSLIAILGFATPAAYSQSIDDSGSGAIEVSDDGAVAAPRPGARVGRKAAEKYMSPRPAQTSGSDSAQSRSTAAELSPTDHYLALTFGGFVSDTAYKWGIRDQQDGTGQSTFGVTYRVGEWRNSMDLGVRIDYNSYSLDAGKANKLSFMPVVSFPDASSKFPLYFGAGVGLGIFTTQLSGESALALDYSLMLGARFFDIADTNAGFVVEAGLKNHLFLASDGQFNGTFVAIGPVFTF
ncbi:MAG: hypothetical protein V4760_15910 [Bdellovibrionota bacterium]